ncbi:MAG: hypothetical protein WBP85_13520 [Terracidiphilus sp.]
MMRFRNRFWLVSAVLVLAGCGGSTSGGGGGGGGATTPTVSVLASPSSITTAQGTTVTVTVSGTNGTPTGSVTLSSGTYSSGAVTLSGGSAQISIAAGKLATGTDTLTASYTSSETSTYNNASGTGSVTVTTPTLLTPTVTVSASPSSITTAQSTTVTVTVSGTSGTPTGSVTLTSGSYNSGAKTLVNGSVQITVPGSSLATANDTLTAAYTPDAGSSSTYNSASGTGSVTVTTPTLLTPTVTVSASPSSITTAQSTTVTVTVSGTSGTPTGSVTLTSGSYNSGAKTLVNGSVQISVPGSSLATASDTLAAAYTPDAGSSSTYNSASGTGSVTVSSSTLTTPSVTVSPNPTSISGSESTTVTVTVSGTGSTPTGSITLTSGTYNSGAQALSNGSVQIVVSASSLANGTDLLHAAYTPDANSSSTYNSATGLGDVSVSANLSITSFTASPNPIPLGQTSTQLTAVFSGGTGVITPGNTIVTSGTPVTVTPTATTVYTLTVTPTTGSPITQTVTVALTGDVAVDFGTTYQTIRGFGGSTAWLGQMPSAVATALFSPSNGLGLSVLRVRIDPEGSPSGGGAHNDPYETGEWDYEAANGQEAIANNPNAVVFATPWTPPISMKTGSNSGEPYYSGTCGPAAGYCGGSLNTTSYAAYAQYLEDFVTFFNTTAGFNLYAISMQNEPEENVSYESCLWSPQQMDTWVANNASTITTDPYSTKFMMPEADSFQPSQALTALQDPNAEGLISIIGGHLYGVSPAPYSIPAGDTPKEIWMTEFGPLSPATLPWTSTTGQSALGTFALSIHDSMVTGQYNAYVWWGVFGDSTGSCGTAAGTCGLVDNSGNLMAMGAVMGQYSKFIQPGFVRVSATASPVSGVYVSAYEYPTGGSNTYNNNYAIVVINTNTASQTLSFTLNNGTVTSLTPYQSTSTTSLAPQSAVTVTSGQFTYTLPAQSIVTFVQ